MSDAMRIRSTRNNNDDERREERDNRRHNFRQAVTESRVAGSQIHKTFLSIALVLQTMLVSDVIVDVIASSHPLSQNKSHHKQTNTTTHNKTAGDIFLCLLLILLIHLQPFDMVYFICRSCTVLLAYCVVLQRSLVKAFAPRLDIARKNAKQKRLNSPGFTRNADPLPAQRKSLRSLNDKQIMDDASSTPERIVEFKLHSSVGSIPAEAWDACLTNTSSPFLSHSWLRCMEESKCASPATGWVPSHVSILIDSETVGFVPLYIKGHSLGEFIFDQQFAEAAYQNGIEYYPKLLVGVPFTPATGNRILWHPQRVLQTFSREEIKILNQSVAKFLKQLASSNKVSSVHINFLTESEAEDLGGPLPRPLDEDAMKVETKIRSILLFQRRDIQDNYLRRTSLQYHWQNSNPNNHGKPFESFDDYLSCFKSKKRINIRRERKKVLEEEGVVIDVIAGKEILKYPGLVERMFEIYLSTIDKMVWGRQYLTVEFFQLLAQSDFIDYLVFVCARRNVNVEQQKLEARDVFAGTFSKC